MKRSTMIAACVFLASSAMTAWGGTKTYQVTGPVLEVKNDAIVVQKGKEKWEVAKDKDTKMSGEVKVGSKVTIMYTMKAETIEAKEEGKKKK